jgi:transposase
MPVHLGLTTGEAHDNRLCPVLLNGLRPRTMLLADRGYDADWIRAFVSEQGAWANIPPKRNRKEAICFSPYLYRARNLVERFFNKIKQCRRIATRYDKLAANYLAFIKLCRFRKLHPFDSRSPANQNMIAGCSLLPSFSSACCATVSSRDDCLKPKSWCCGINSTSCSSARRVGYI